jgi:hypothetical protein
MIPWRGRKSSDLRPGSSLNSHPSTPFAPHLHPICTLKCSRQVRRMCPKARGDRSITPVYTVRDTAAGTVLHCCASVLLGRTNNPWHCGLVCSGLFNCTLPRKSRCIPYTCADGANDDPPPRRSPRVNLPFAVNYRCHLSPTLPAVIRADGSLVSPPSLGLRSAASSPSLHGRVLSANGTLHRRASSSSRRMCA